MVLMIFEWNSAFIQQQLLFSSPQSHFRRPMSPEALRERLWRGAAKLARDATSVESTIDQPLYQVFLGGSCGNTVWRGQEVIPHLKKLGISYYDPQRTEWSEHMINEEAVAKEVRISHFSSSTTIDPSELSTLSLCFGPNYCQCHFFPGNSLFCR
jgi:hypothetical protein